MQRELRVKLLLFYVESSKRFWASDSDVSWFPTCGGSPHTKTWAIPEYSGGI